ncbi:hypothetical protein C8N40_106106 [Pontibacter mucosus]|uniref:Uncharacterized protein n=1 Tax=Pontibacter mucosus TaxID=1649266 RepID=A0A2T5YG57_9BACT|nr:hypothetical protein C8N40_106106 [Pontibacter mucosus]
MAFRAIRCTFAYTLQAIGTLLTPYALCYRLQGPAPRHLPLPEEEPAFIALRVAIVTTLETSLFRFRFKKVYILYY